MPKHDDAGERVHRIESDEPAFEQTVGVRKGSHASLTISLGQLWRFGLML